MTATSGGRAGHAIRPDGRRRGTHRRRADLHALVVERRSLDDADDLDEMAVVLLHLVHDVASCRRGGTCARRRTGRFRRRPAGSRPSSGRGPSGSRSRSAPSSPSGLGVFPAGIPGRERARRGRDEGQQEQRIHSSEPPRAALPATISRPSGSAAGIIPFRQSVAIRRGIAIPDREVSMFIPTLVAAALAVAVQHQHRPAPTSSVP